MKIELSSTEYRDLLDILHMADVVMSGHRREEDKRTERHRALVQKLYALAQGQGLERLMGHDKVLNRYVPTPGFEHESPAHPVLREFGDHLFWDELIDRLTTRDMAQMAGGMERLNTLSASRWTAPSGSDMSRNSQRTACPGWRSSSGSAATRGTRP